MIPSSTIFAKNEAPRCLFWHVLRGVVKNDLCKYKTQLICSHLEEEFISAIRRMKKGKATGPDGIPAEVWQQSKVAQKTLFLFLRRVWREECVPDELVLCVFVLIFKRKGSRDDCSKYRAIGRSGDRAVKSLV